MILVTKKIGDNENDFNLAWAINLGIRRSSDIEGYKKRLKVRAKIRKGTIEEYVVNRKACLIASTNEIYDWMEKNSPKDKRLKNRVVHSDNDVRTVWLVDYVSPIRGWSLIPMRHIGKR